MDKLRKMLRMIAKGKCPEAADLGMGREEFVQLVSHALDNGYIEGVYISFCDNSTSFGPLSSARLTEEGKKTARRFWG